MTVLEGKHALITGAGGGIGASIAEALRAAGARLSLAGRTESSLQAVSNRLGGDTAAISADITDPDDVQSVFHKAKEAHGPVQILVNCAGQAQSAPFKATDDALWNRMLEVNLTGTYRCCRQALPDMLSNGWGRIVNVASTAGLVGYPYVSAYCASKHGVIGLTKALALELATESVTVNAVCPGYTETDIVEKTIENITQKTGRTPEQALKALVSRNPQQRLVLPSEVADAVRWLCSPGSASITGQSIAVAGGEIM